MKYRIMAAFFLSVMVISAQADTTNNLSNKWNKFKERAKEKTEKLKLSMEEAAEKNRLAMESKQTTYKKSPAKKKVEKIPATQHLVTKNFKDGTHKYYSVKGDEWEEKSYESKSKLILDDNGNVEIVEIFGSQYIMAEEYDGMSLERVGQQKKLNTHFRNKKLYRYGVYIDGSFYTFVYKGSGDNIKVEDVYASNKPSIKPDKLIKMLIQHDETIKEEKMKIPNLKYKWVSNRFENNWRIVLEESKYGIINENNQLVTQFKYDSILNYSEGYFWVSEKREWSLLDKNAKIVDDSKYETVTIFSNGIASIKKGKKTGILDKNLNQKWLFTQNEFDFLINVGKGYITEKDGSFGLISKTKNTLLACEYIKIKYEKAYEENMLIVQGKDKLFGYYKIGDGWITERVYGEAMIRYGSIPRDGKYIPYHTYKVRVSNPQRTKRSNTYSLDGSVELDGTIKWENDLITVPFKSKNQDKLPWRENYSTRFRVIDGRPLIATKVNERKYGLMDTEGNEITEFKYKQISEKHPMYYLFVERYKAIEYNYNTKKYSKDTVRYVDKMDEIFAESANKYADPNYGSSSSSSYSSSNSSSSSSSSSSNNSSSNSSGAEFKGSVKIVNNTGTKYHYQWKGKSSGSGYINNGSSTTTSCKKGGKFYISESNKSSDKEFVLELTPDMCGKTIKLADYL